MSNSPKFHSTKIQFTSPPSGAGMATAIHAEFQECVVPLERLAHAEARGLVNSSGQATHDLYRAATEAIEGGAAENDPRSRDRPVPFNLTVGTATPLSSLSRLGYICYAALCCGGTVSITTPDNKTGEALAELLAKINSAMNKNPNPIL